MDIEIPLSLAALAQVKVEPDTEALTPPDSQSAQKIKNLERKCRTATRLQNETEDALQRAQKVIVRLREERNALLDRLYRLQHPSSPLAKDHQPISPVSDFNPLPLESGKDAGSPLKVNLTYRSRALGRQIYQAPSPAASSEVGLSSSSAAGTPPAIPSYVEPVEVKIENLQGQAQTPPQRKRKVSDVRQPAGAQPDLAAIGPMSKPTKGRKLSANAGPRISYIPKIQRGPNQQPILPIVSGLYTLLSLGEINLNPGYANARFIFPVGYRVSRSFPSMVHATKTTQYVCEIAQGDANGPVFRIEARDNPGAFIESPTPSAAVLQVTRAVNNLRKRTPPSGNGPDFYGLSCPLFRALVQSLPNAKEVVGYIPQTYVEVLETSPSRSSSPAPPNEKKAQVKRSVAGSLPPKRRVSIPQRQTAYMGPPAQTSELGYYPPVNNFTYLPPTTNNNYNYNATDPMTNYGQQQFLVSPPQLHWPMSDYLRPVSPTHSDPGPMAHDFLAGLPVFSDVGGIPATDSFPALANTFDAFTFLNTDFNLNFGSETIPVDIASYVN